MGKSNPLSRLSVAGAVGALLAVLAVFGCGPSYRVVHVLLPPQLELVPYGRIGLVTFTVENAKGSLHEFATRRFEEDVLAAQRGIEVLELGPADSVLRRVGQRELGPAAAQGLGGEGGVPAVFFGHLKVSNVKPNVGLIGLTLPHLEATVSVELWVELLSTRSGGTVWRASAAVTEKVGEVALVGGMPYFSAQNPNDAYGLLVNRLVAAVTHDLRPTWEERKERE